MAASLPLPHSIKPPSRSFLEAAETSKLLDWELDSLMSEKSETIARSLFNYRNLKAVLKNQCDHLSSEQERLDENRSNETATVLVMGSWGALDSLDDRRAETRDYARQICDLNKQILSLKISVLCLKIARLSGAIKKLLELESTNGSKVMTPPELCFQKFDEWVQSNEKIYNLQSYILDLEANKVRLHKSNRTTKERKLSISSVTTKHSFASVLEGHPGKSADPARIEHGIEELTVTDAAPTRNEATLAKLLQVSAQNQSFEACKLKGYIRECWEVEHVDDDFPTGIHQDRYQEFVGGMCQYIIDKQFCGGLSYDFVFSKLEHHLIPAIFPRIKQHIQRPDDDAKLARLSKKLSGLTQNQFGIKEECQDCSVVPYSAAISALKTCSLCLLPSGKIQQIVKAAKLVFEVLNEIAAREHSCPPGADEFMDVWVYVVLKANIPNFASMVAFLKHYSNPNLAFSEAGYYLSSIEFACQYILRLSEHDFHVCDEDGIGGNIIVCEQHHYKGLAAEEDPLFEVVSVNKWLTGYELYAVKEWQLDPLRFYRTVLLPSSNPKAQVQVSVVRINTDVVSSSQIQCLNNVFLEPSEAHGLSSIKTSLGRAIVLEASNLERNLTLIHIPNGQYDKVKDDIKWYCTLGRLSCIQPMRYNQHRNSLLEIQMIPEFTANAENKDANNDKSNVFVKCGSNNADEDAVKNANNDVERNTNTDFNKDVYRDGKEDASNDATTTASSQTHNKPQSFSNSDLSMSSLSIDSFNSDLDHLQVLPIEFVTEAAEQKQKLVQSVYTKDGHSLNQLITSVVHLILTLGYLNPLLIETIAPFYSNVILLAVRHFQMDYNESVERSNKLPTNGHLTPMTLQAMKDLVEEGIAHLQRLGFQYNGPVSLVNKKDHTKLTKFISQCQDSLAIEVHMKGALDSQTRAEIKRLVADM